MVSMVLWTASVLASVTLLVAKLVNGTIDDTGTNVQGYFVVYDPSDAWNNGLNCSSCTAHPNASEMYLGTWHDSTFNTLSGSNNEPNTVLNASMTFNGTAVYVQCALALTSASPTGTSDMTFYIDNTLVGTFFHTPPNITGYDYNVTVFSTTSLSNDQHTLMISNGHVNGTKALVILDSIIYTYDDGQSETTSASQASSTDSAEPISGNGPNINVIVPAVVVPVGTIFLAIGLFLLYRYRKRKQDSSQVNLTAPTPFTAVPSTGVPYMVQGTSNAPSSSSFNPYGTFTGVSSIGSVGGFVAPVDSSTGSVSAATSSTGTSRKYGSSGGHSFGNASAPVAGPSHVQQSTIPEEAPPGYWEKNRYIRHR